MQKSEKIKYIIISVIFFIVGFLVSYIVFLDKEVYDSLEMEEEVGGTIQGNIDTLNQEQNEEIKPRQEITYIVSPETGTKLKSVEVDYDVNGNITQERIFSKDKNTEESDYFYRNDGKVDYILNKIFYHNLIESNVAIKRQYKYSVNGDLESAEGVEVYKVEPSTGSLTKDTGGSLNHFLDFYMQPTSYEYYDDGKVKASNTAYYERASIKEYYYRNDGKIDNVMEINVGGGTAFYYRNQYVYNQENKIIRINTTYEGYKDYFSNDPIIKEENYSTQRETYILYSYNQDGKLNKTETYNNENKLIEVIKYTYNQDGTLNKKETYNNDNKLIEIVEYIY